MKLTIFFAVALLYSVNAQESAAEESAPEVTLAVASLSQGARDYYLKQYVMDRASGIPEETAELEETRDHELEETRDHELEETRDHELEDTCDHELEEKHDHEHPQSLKPDPYEILLGSKSRDIHARSELRDGELFHQEDKGEGDGLLLQKKKKGIFGLKTILLRYFIMPIKKTIAFLFEEVDNDTHFVTMKKGVKADKAEKTFKCQESNKTGSALGQAESNQSSSAVLYIPESELVTEMNSSSGCGVVLFYTPYCRFSIELLPAYNALSRLFPQLSLLAVEINSYSSSCIHFGAVGTPTVMFYHNSRPVRKMPPNARNVTTMTEYIVNITDLEPEGAVELHASDYDNVELLSSFDWVLLFSAIFLFSSLCYNLSYTTLGRALWDRVAKLKRE